MQRGNVYFTFCLFALLTAMVLPAESATINVSTNASDVLGDNNICSLREAITNINNATNTYTDCASVAGSYGTADIINLPAGTYTNSIAVAGSSPNNATGDLNILKSVSINGAGTWRTTIDGGSIDTVIWVGSTVTANISGVTIQKGYGGIYNAGTLYLTNSTISSNTANIYFGSGGGISNAGTLYITNSTISGNRAADGGGIYNGGYTGGTLYITNSTISGNRAIKGGGIYNGGSTTGGTVVITNSTISGNTGNYFSGGVYNRNGPITVYSSTITNNTAGGVFAVNSSSTITFTNTIVANQASKNDCYTSAGVIIDRLNNLDSDGTCGATKTGNPQLGPLQDNGGPTWTHAISANSLAIDSGNTAACVTADQRGVKRTQGSACDIGAYEAELAILVLPSGTIIGTTPTFFWHSMLGAVSYSLEVSDSIGNLWITSYNAKDVCFGTVCFVTPTRTLVGGNYKWSISGLIGSTVTSGTWSPPSAKKSFYVSYHQVKSDFDGDGKSDILWRHANGTTVMWQMNGSTLSTAKSLGMVPPDWNIAGLSDFNGDGKEDILWRHSSGITVLWLMNGSTLLSATSLGVVPTSWSIIGSADFNGDGKGDILWRHNSGVMALWMMNGATIQSSGSPGSVPTSWAVADTADFNGDGKSDILWRHSSGITVMWLMNGSAILSGGSLGTVPVSWSIAGTADFDGDGKSDILWHHSSGVTALWLMNGTTLLSGTGLGVVPPSWTIIDTADFNGDGKGDILWRHSSGVMSMWLMNGATIQSSGSPGSVPTPWGVQK